MAAVEAPITAPQPLHPAAAATGARKWFAIGTGVAIEIAGPDLRVIVVRVRPSGVEVTALTNIFNCTERPANEWGAEYAAFARRHNVAGVPVWVVLPRREVIVRHVNLPGVAAKDLAAAVSYQIDGLHPYADGAVAHSWAQLPGTSTVMVGVTRQEIVDEFANRFAEAGIRMAGFTFTAAALYSASRILVTPPAAFLALHDHGTTLEAYGESPHRPVFSGWFDDEPGVVEPRAFSELRSDEAVPTGSFADLMPAPLRTPEGFDRAMWAPVYAAGICAACPRLSLSANLLPEDRRTQSARWVYIPTAILAALLLAAVALWAWQPSYHDKQYLEHLNGEIRRFEKSAAAAARLDTELASARARIDLLDQYRLRSRADADALREVTNLLAAPSWIQSLLLTRNEVQMTGETDQSSGLLKTLDASPLFKDSTFMQSSMARNSGGGEQFAIRTIREAMIAAPAPVPAAPAPAVPAAAAPAGVAK